MEDQRQYLKEWDVFISYASEDADIVARPIAEGLRCHGLRVWFDEFELCVGDSLVKSINHGLANSSYGVVILSPNFIAKKWPQRELAALVSLEETHHRRILPVWHELGAKELRASIPMLADIVAVQSSAGIPGVVRELLRAINLPFAGESIAGVWTGKTGRLRLFNIGAKLQGDYDWNGYEWAGHIEGSIKLSSHPESLPNPILRFRWWWDLNPENGNGFFVAKGLPRTDFGSSYYSSVKDIDSLMEHLQAQIYHIGPDIPILSGTWAFDHEGLDLGKEDRDLIKMTPHPWDFERSPRIR